MLGNRIRGVGEKKERFILKKEYDGTLLSFGASA